MATTYPGFQPRLGLGEPSPAPCDPSTNRQLRNGFTFQVRHVITGHCVFLGAFLEAQTQPMPKFAPVLCGTPKPPCPTCPPKPPKCPQQVFWGIGPPTISPEVSAGVYFDVANPQQVNVWSWAQGVWNELIGN